MRRKSTRNAQKATPEKAPKEIETPPKTRRSRRRKRSPSKSSESEDEVLTVTKRAPLEETPDTTTKSHTPSDEETEEPMWKVTSSEGSPKGEIQKLKICLTRPSPDSPKKRRSKSNSQTEDETTSSEDKGTRRTRSRGSPFVRNDGLSSQEGDEDVEEKKGKGKSKGKHKTKIEKSPHVSEVELQTNNEISENVQVTPQSPSIDKPVDNENDHKVDVADIQNVNEREPENESNEDSACKIDNSHNQETVVAETTETENDSKNKESDDDEPLSVIQKNVVDHKSTKEQVTAENQNDTATVQEESVEQTEEAVPSKLEEPSEPEEAVPSKLEEPSKPEEAVPSKLEEPSKPEEAVPSKLEEPSKPEEVVPSKPEEVVPSKLEEAVPNKLEETVLNEPQIETIDKIEEQEIEKPVTEPEKQIAEVVGITPDESQVTESEVEKASDDLPVIEVQHQSEVIENKASPQTEEAVQLEPEVAVVESKNNEEQSFSPTEDNHQVATKERMPQRRRLRRNHESVHTDQSESEEPASKTRIQRKWEIDSSLTSLLKVSLDSIQTVWPSIDFPEEPDLNLEIEKERRTSVESSGKKLERKVSVEYKSEFSERPTLEKQTSVSSGTNDEEDKSNIIAFNRKISIVDDTASKLKPPPSPAKNPVSSILFITNLVRPFTVKQLKELLERTGKVTEEGFWTDRIKSKCYVQYETQEEAEATRNALHGVQWPIGNGKKLIIDYATEEDMQNAKNPPAPPTPVTPVPDTKAAVKENLEPVENKVRAEEKSSKEMEKKRPEGPVREWDIGKKDVRRERSRSRDRGRKHRRSPSPADDFISRKQRKAEESVPQKLMDDLFLKTKATPSIYWQPLSPEEISMKQQQRLIRMEEHKRRMEENTRMKGRDMGRGAFRRRYD